MLCIGEERALNLVHDLQYPAKLLNIRINCKEIVSFRFIGLFSPLTAQVPNYLVKLPRLASLVSASVSTKSFISNISITSLW